MSENTLPTTTFLVCKNAMLAEGIRHILSGTRYRLHPENPAIKKEAFLDISDKASVLFILDANLHHEQTKDEVRRLKTQYPDAQVVVLADCFEMSSMMASLNAGASGYCLSTIGCETLIKYLDLVMLGEIVFPSAMLLAALTERREATGVSQSINLMGGEITALSSGTLPTRMLSTREAEILHCLMEGAPNKTIARKLEVAEATVKVHVKAILRKIRVTNRTQAAMWAVAHFSNAGNSDQHLSS